MEYKRFGDTVVLRVIKGEELLSVLAELAENESIQTASVSGLGAAGEVILGIFDTSEKKYFSRQFLGTYEIASLTGNMTRQNGKPYLHLHAVIANAKTGECHGGHLNRAVICATGELIITILPGAVGRFFDEETGLNLLQF